MFVSPNMEILTIEGGVAKACSLQLSATFRIRCYNLFTTRVQQTLKTLAILWKLCDHS
jgi:hypothetical protein